MCLYVPYRGAIEIEIEAVEDDDDRRDGIAENRKSQAARFGAENVVVFGTKIVNLKWHTGGFISNFEF